MSRVLSAESVNLFQELSVRFAWANGKARNGVVPRERQKNRSWTTFLLYLVKECYELIVNGKSLITREQSQALAKVWEH